MSYARELEVAIQACLQAAHLCEAVRANIPEAIEKSDRSPVTVSDRSVSRFDLSRLVS